MSHPYDCNEPRDVRTVETDCVECGAHGRFPASHGKCPPCIELGQRPPSCLVCGGTLRGAVRLRSFECRGCDSVFNVSTIRTYALGLAVERIALEERQQGGEGTYGWGLVLRAARVLKVIS